jgi:hypothetical protein
MKFVLYVIQTMQSITDLDPSQCLKIRMNMLADILLAEFVDLTQQSWIAHF